MQTIVDLTGLLLISVGIAVVLLYIFHRLAYRLGFERGLLKPKFPIVIFIIGVIVYLYWTGFLGVILTSTLTDMPIVITQLLIAMGFGIILLTICLYGVGGGPVPVPAG